jgi:hypothetical protein
MRAWIVLVAVVGACLAGLLAMPADPLLGKEVPTTAVDRLAAALSGDGTILHLLSGLVVYGGFAFVLQLRESQEARGMLHQRLLRHGSATRWAAARTRRHVVAAVAYLTVVAALGLEAAVLTGSPRVLPDLDRLGLLAGQYLVGGLLQLGVYSALVLIATWLARGPAAGLVTVGVIVAGGALQLQTRTWLPVQLADLAVTRGGWPEVGHATATLGLGVAVLGLALTGLVTFTRPA